MSFRAPIIKKEEEFNMKKIRKESKSPKGDKRLIVCSILIGIIASPIVVMMFHSAIQHRMFHRTYGDIFKEYIQFFSEILHRFVN